MIAQNFRKGAKGWPLKFKMADVRYFRDVIYEWSLGGKGGNRVGEGVILGVS